MNSISEQVEIEVAKIIASRMLMSTTTSIFGYGLQAFILKDYTSHFYIFIWLLMVVSSEVINGLISFFAKKNLEYPEKAKTYKYLQLFGLLLSGSCWGSSAFLPGLWEQSLAFFSNVFILVIVGIFSIHNFCLRWQTLAAFSFGLLTPTFMVSTSKNDHLSLMVDSAAVVAFFLIQVYGLFTRKLEKGQIINNLEMKKLTHEVTKKNEELLRLIEVVERLASHDPLTNCLNRRALSQKYSVSDKRRKDDAETLGIIMIDADHFKSINDRYGHEVGDQVLVEMVARIKSQLRISDSLSRWGGEEFLSVISNVDQDGLFATAERIRLSIAEAPILWKSGSVHVTASLGIALTRGQESFEEAVNRADQSLYKAKNSGRNTVEA